MKNVTTPRTLADSTFVTGYHSADYSDACARVERRAHAFMYVLAAVVGACFLAGYIVEKMQ